MAIIVDTTSPSDLLRKIKKAIDDGKVRSWSYGKDGDFTHDSDQWKNKARLRPKVYNGIAIWHLEAIYRCDSDFSLSLTGTM